MPRAPRIQYEGAIYHVMARGNRREPIVFDDQDRKCFVQTLGEVCQRTGWEVFAWVLLDNHYHLAIRTPEPNLVTGMSWFQNTFTRRINTRNQLWGHLFGGRYKAILVEDDVHGDSQIWQDYLLTLIDYIHLNPARAGLVDGSERSIREYPWSSIASGYGVAPGKRASWLSAAEGLSLFQERDTVAGRKRFVDRLDRWAASEAGESAGFAEKEGQSLQSTLRRGWYWGSEHFKEKLLETYGQERIKQNKRGLKGSPAVRDHALKGAEEIIREGCLHFGMEEAEIREGRRGDLKKASLAWAIWKQTSAPQSWIAERLALKSAANVSQTVRRFDRLERVKMGKEEWKWKKRKSIIFS
tara:strand:- start:1745 stop:2809 length:1065 start_codon:yes stop_codon:yes gene_type:complete